MALSITNESKNALSISNEARNGDLTWNASDPLTWNDARGDWNTPRLPFNKDSKNSLTISNDSK